MQKNNDPIKPREGTLLFAFFALFLFASPVTIWWASDDHHWLLPYGLWLLIIVIGAWLRSRYKRHDL